MLYGLALLLPPLALWLDGEINQGLFSALLLSLGVLLLTPQVWPVAVVHAWVILWLNHAGR